MTGLLGSGFDEIPYLLFGARPRVGGGSHSRDATYSTAAR